MNFVDLYIGKDFADLKGLAGTTHLRTPAPAELLPQVDKLRVRCRAQVDADDEPEFALLVDEVSYRVTYTRDVDGADIFVLRPTKAAPQARPIEAVGLAPALVRSILQPDLRGLVLLVGETGMGKTTTACALLRARLSRIGGICVAIEDPPEMDLNGEHGLGRCVQIRASRKTGGYKEHLVRGLRMNPDMLFLGEVREEAAAEEVVRASLNGHLVLSTLHAGSIPDAIDRLALFAGAGSSMDNAYRNIAAGLKIIIWQQLKVDAAGRMHLTYQALSLVDGAFGMPVTGARSKIARGQAGHLLQDVDQFMTLLLRKPY